MSNDVRGVLHGAAAKPSTEANVAGAWKRGRRLRTRRLAAGGLGIVAIVAIGSVALVNALPNNHTTAPAGPTPTTIPAACAPPSTTAALPTWTKSANPPPDVPHLVSPDGNVAAVVFGNPLWAPESPNRSNKILWIVRQPRNGRPLEITATLEHSNLAPVRLSAPANASPGEVYPFDTDVTAPGCWHFALSWNGHHSALNLEYVPAPTTSTTLPVTTTPPVTTATTTPVTTETTTCQTANLTLTLGPPNGTAGHMNYELAFHNDGASACTMTGYPGVSFVNASLTQIGSPAQRNPIAFVPVTLAPGATGYAHLAVTDPSVLSGCASTPTTWIRVYPPNETHSALVGSRGIAICATSTDASSIDPVLDHSIG